MSDPLRSGAIFRADLHVLQSPVPRVVRRAGESPSAPPPAAAAAGSSASAPLGPGSAYRNSLHRPAAQKPSVGGGGTRTTFEELYQASPLPKVVASHYGRIDHRPTPTPRVVPDVPKWSSNPGAITQQPERRELTPTEQEPAATETGLVRWCLRRHIDGGEARVCVSGVSEAGGGRGEQTAVTSSPIRVRVAARKVISSSGSVYSLQGDMEDEHDGASGLHPSVLEEFRAGFPQEWKEVLRQGQNAAGQDDSEVEPESGKPDDTVVPDSDSDTESSSVSSRQLTHSPRSSSSRQATSQEASAQDDADAEAKARAKALSITQAQKRMAADIRKESEAQAASARAAEGGYDFEEEEEEEEEEQQEEQQQQQQQH